MSSEHLEEQHNANDGFSMRGLFEAQIEPEVRPDRDRLMKAAEVDGVSLDERRMHQLMVTVEDIREFEEPGPFYGPITEGLHYDGETHNIDFNPVTEEESLGATSPQPQEATRVMLNGLRGMQDLMLIVDAGYLPRPNELNGKTNPVMATIAQRLGFELGERSYSSVHGEQIQVRADFELVRSRVFSEEARRIEALLEKRLYETEGGVKGGTG